MLNDEDINKLTTVLASKKDVEDIKGDLDDLKGLTQNIGLKLAIE